MAIDLTFTDSDSSTTNATEYTFSAQSLGTADAERQIIVGAWGSSGAGVSVSSLTIGGVSASLIIAQNGATNPIAELWIADVPTGTTGDVVVTFNDGKLRAGIGVWRLIGGTVGDSDKDTTTSTATMTATVNVEQDGAVVGFVGGVTDDATAITWGGATEDFDTLTESVGVHSGAHEDELSADATYDVTATQAGDSINLALVACSIDPEVVASSNSNFLMFM